MVTTAAVIVAAVAASTEIAAGLAKGQYLLTASTDCWVKQGATGLAASAGGANCFFLGKGSSRVLTVSDATANGFLAAIRLAADGHLSVARIDA